ncbi:MAG TPA: 3-dehydroquinate synthase [Bacteroidales bacterium]|nr:3-dehydroquinate synthase [Bacteroidales bacterium]
MEIKFDNKKTHVYMGDAWDLTKKLLSGKDVIIISDINVNKLYGYSFPDYPVITIGTGEAVKELDTVKTIIKHLIAIGADRSSFLLGIGGGVVCDITGFVASVFMRGIDFGFISTTLLSQVDASIGGKNGVNVNGIKNIIGCIKQPSFVICDSGLLNTLPDEEYISGLGELVKHALIKDKELFRVIEDNISPVLKRMPDLLEELISKSIVIKIAVVERDEMELGERKLLNFGHTLGHAIESTTGLSHGISIASGMMAAVEISYNEGLINKKDVERIRSLFTNLGLLPEIKIRWPAIRDKIFSDKKRRGNNISFILLEKIGHGIQKEYLLEDILKKLHKQFS